MGDGEMQWKDLRVNVNKARGMQLLFGKKSSVSKMDPCGVCDERVGYNSIQCTVYIARRRIDVEATSCIYGGISEKFCLICFFIFSILPSEGDDIHFKL